MSAMLDRVDAALREIDAALKTNPPVRGYASRLVMAARQLCVVRDDERARQSRIAALASCSADEARCERGCGPVWSLSWPGAGSGPGRWTMTKDEIRQARVQRLAALMRRQQGADVPVTEVWEDFGDGISAEANIRRLGPFAAFVRRCGLTLERRQVDGRKISLLHLTDAAARDFLAAAATMEKYLSAVARQKRLSEARARYDPLHAPTLPQGVEEVVEAAQEKMPMLGTSFDEQMAQMQERIDAGRVQGCRVRPVASETGEADELRDVPLRPVTLDTGAALHALGAGWERIYRWAGSDESLVLLEVHEALERMRCGAEQDGDRLTVLAGGIVLGQRAEGGAA